MDLATKQASNDVAQPDAQPYTRPTPGLHTLHQLDITCHTRRRGPLKEKQYRPAAIPFPFHVNTL